MEPDGSQIGFADEMHASNFVHPPASSPEMLSAAASQELVLRWLDEAREAFAGGRCGKILDAQGLDLFDAALSELNLTMLAVLRQAPTGAAPVGPRVSGLRRLAFRWKRALADRRAKALSAAPVASDVLLWPRDITHTVVLHPVMKALEAQGVRCQMLACQERILREVRERSTNVIYAPATWPRELRAARREAARRLKQLDGLRPWSLPDFAGRAAANFEAAVYATLSRVMPTALEAAANTTRALQATGARALVVGNDLTVEGRVATRVSRQQGVPSAVLMHGTITGIPLNERHTADRIFVFGETHRRELLERGIEDSRIVISGDPNLDGRPRQTGQIHAALRERLGLEQGKPWVLVCTSGPGHRVSHGHHEQVVASLGRLADAVPEVPVVIKLHAKDRMAYYEALLANGSRKNVHVIPRGTEGFPVDIYEWLNGATVLLTGASTTAIEAMLMDVPVITMDYCRELEGIDFIEAGATLHVSAPSELDSAVRQVISGSEPSSERAAHIADFLRSTYYALDGRASQRVAESIRQLAGVNAKS